MIPQSTINACVKAYYGSMESTDYGKIQAVLLAYNAIESLSRQGATRASEAGDSELLNVIDLIRTGKDGRKYDYAISRADTMVHVAPLFAAAPAPGGG